MEETRSQPAYSMQLLHSTTFDINYGLLKCGILRKSLNTTLSKMIIQQIFYSKRNFIFLWLLSLNLPLFKRK